MPASGPSPSIALPSGIDERRFLRTLFWAYPESLVVVDQTGSIVSANASVAILLGYTVDELVGMNVDALVPDSLQPRHAVYREDYALAPRARPMGVHADLVAKRKDGTEVMVEIALSPLQDHGLTLVVAAIRGVGSYPRVQQALKRALYSEFLTKFGRVAVDARDAQVLLEMAPQIAAEALQVPISMVVLLDLDRKSFRVASGVGLVPGEEVGERIAAEPSTSPGFLLMCGEAVTIEDYRSETRFKVPVAYLDAGLISALAVPLYDRGRIIGTLAVRSREAMHFGDEEKRFLSSLSSLLSTSLQRAQSEDALNHAQRLESVGQLTGGIAHDFNNLLTVIQGNMQMLEDLPSLAANNEAVPLLAAAIRASRRAADLTSKLLAFSRRQVLQPSVVNPVTLLHSLADMLRRTLDQHIHIEVRTQSDCPPVLADAIQLESALLNIAINARDAMPQGGMLVFSAEKCSELPPSVRLDLDDPHAEEENFVVLSVSDTGTGMADHVLARAFEPFFTTKDAGRGTGLGLSTVHGFVKQSHGALSIESTLGIGTTLTLYLPRSTTQTEQMIVEEDCDSTVPPGLKVLLVEDDGEVRKVVQTYLRVMGCILTLVATAEEALAELGSDAHFDLLLSDIALGSGQRGTGLALNVQQQYPDLPVLLMSGFSADILEADQLSPPGWGLLLKPFSRHELARAIVQALGVKSSDDSQPQ